MAHERGHPRLLLEAAGIRSLAERVGLGDLDNADLVQVDVAGLVDLAHPAFADFLEDLVLSVQCLPGRQPRRRVTAGRAESRNCRDR